MSTRYCDGERYCSRCGEAYRNYCLRCGLKLRKEPRNGRKGNKKRIEVEE
jgi:predicted amidophosphoribosyltransferase